MKALLIASLLSVGTLGNVCLAADMAQPGPAPGEPGWTFEATAYGWFAGLSGDVGVRGLPPASLDISPIDVINALDAIPVMGSLTARNGDWSIMGEIIWVKLAAEANFGPANGEISYRQTQLLASGVVGYDLPLNLPEGMDLTATAGFRYNHIKATLDVSPALFPVTISREGSVDWIDPTIGLAFNYKINDRWFMNLTGDIGGFGVGSDFTTQGIATVGYMWTPTISTSIGWRALYTDYSEGGFVYDTTEQGLYTTIGVRF